MYPIPMAIAAVIALPLVLSACGGSETSAADEETVTIALAGPMTGENGIYGQNQLAGLQFAVDQLNEAGGIPSGPLEGKTIEIKDFDDAADPNQGASVAQQICDDSSIIATFGHTNSSVTLAAEPIYERCGMPLLVSYSSNPEITAEPHDNLFRTLVDDAKLGAEMATLAQAQLGFTQVGILASPDDYGDGLTENFTAAAEEIDLDVVDAITTSAGQKDFTPQLTTLRNDGADGVVLLNTYSDAALQIKQARAMGWDVQFLAPPGANNPELISIAGADAAEGTAIAALFDPASTEAGAKEFIDSFAAAEGEAPGEASAMAYDSFFVMLAALEDGADDRASLMETIAEIGTFELPIAGEITFNDNHEPTTAEGETTQVLLQVTDGAIGSYVG